ncbi:pectinesterase-like [Cornus florida]|uniref:pectinesterase-like n=1 Tax=Cornus florida TaxID=4283 RepID=UPI0028A0D0F3|nr:pectinesterase-like [Cornus florida]
MLKNMDKKKKKIAIIVGVVILVIILIIVIAAAARKPKKAAGKPKKSKKAMDTICEVTDYKETCKSRLTAGGGEELLDPKDFIKLGFQVAQKEVAAVMAQINDYANEFKDPKVFNMCKELLNGSISDLQDSFNKLNSTSIDKSNVDGLLSDIKTWLSGAITYQQTCLDAFTGKASEKMKERMMISGELSSNSLAMVTELSSVFEAAGKGPQIPELSKLLGGRRLLEHESSHEFPSWVDSTARRLLAATPATIKPNVVVAQDGSGKYKTISEAVKEVPLHNRGTFVIHVKAGIYKENVQITKAMHGVMIIGDGPTKTKITGSNSNGGDGLKTYETATLGSNGDRFIVKDIAIENTAGLDANQAVALRVTADRAIIYNCQIDSHQDTLYAHNHRQFYRDCTISGTVDFVFGNAAAVFQNCRMLVRRPKDNQGCMVTAQSRTDERMTTGFVLQNCTITADPELAKGGPPVSAFLGRPWRNFSRVVIMNSQIDNVIAPEGWSPWNTTNVYLDTLWYAELNNRGPGADTSKRVTWKGIKKITPAQAEEFIPKKFIFGDGWIPTTGVPYEPGMMKT